MDEIDATVALVLPCIHLIIARIRAPQAISSGYEGSKLSHNHKTQFSFVLQSLTLWRNVLHDMFSLWQTAEDDLLAPNNYYRLRNTGQGLQRMQACPRTTRAMAEQVQRAHEQVRQRGICPYHSLSCVEQVAHRTCARAAGRERGLDRVERRASLRPGRSQCADLCRQVYTGQPAGSLPCARSPFRLLCDSCPPCPRSRAC